MQKSIISLAALALLVSCGQEKNHTFELQGTFSDSKGETIYLEKLTSPKPVLVDSTVVDEKGHFEFKNYAPHIGFYRIKTSPQNFGMLVLDSNDKVTITASIKDLGNTYKVEGSPETTLFMEYGAISKKRDMKLDSLNNAFQAIMETRKKDSTVMDSVFKTFEKPYNAILATYNGLLSEKIKKNNGMFASIMAIQNLDPDKFSDVFKSLDEGLSKRFPNNRDILMFHEMVNKMLASTIGKQAPDIVLPSPEGNITTLSALKGKIVLIDFWASWCGPCRKEMPNVVKAYAKYKSKGFEIFGVSLDKDKDKWVEAIKKDGITWPQVSDLQFWNSSVVKQYNVESIPFTVLLDREGKILAKNLRGADLEKKLAEVLN